jgi:hypothetical protein
MVTEAGYLDIPTQKDLAGYLNYPADIRDTAKSGMGRIGNRRLHYFAEFISVNVGGSYRNGKESSPLRGGRSVGGLRVVGGWESQPQGEAAIRSLEMTPGVRDEGLRSKRSLITWVS